MKEKHNKHGHNQAVWGRIAEDFVKYRLQLKSKGSVQKKWKKYYDLVEVYGDLNRYNECKIEVKACQIFYTNPYTKRQNIGSFKICYENHKKLCKEMGTYVFVYMYKNKILFAICRTSLQIDTLPRNYFYIKNKTKSKYFNLKGSFFADEDVMEVL